MFLSSSFPPLSLLRLPLTPPPDLPLRSPRSLLRRDIDPVIDLDPDLDLIVNDPEAAVPLDLFLPLLQGEIASILT